MNDNLPLINFLNKIEVLLATVTFAAFIYFLVNTIESPYAYNSFDVYKYEFESRGMSYSYFGDHFLPLLAKYLALYVSYLALHLVVVKNLAIHNRPGKHITIAVGLFIFCVATWTISTFVLKAYLLRKVDNATVVKLGIFVKCFFTVLALYSLYAAYAFGKYNLPGVLKQWPIKDHTDVIKDAAVLSAIWVTFMILFQAPGTSDGYSLVWVFAALPCIPLYIYSYASILPSVKNKGKSFGNYLLRVAVIALPILLMVNSVYLWRHGKLAAFIIFLLFDLGFILGLALASWFFYNLRLEKNKELTGLKTALGQSSANVDLLRSQINPHFLFNALNTLYGTAIQENADRTGEGIQRLGDMMRFMLQENVQEQIALTREIDYLNNYITLQKLRTQTSPDIAIQVEIDERPNNLQIAPMLLIPFVENAFKHGISLRNPSHIKVTLNTKGNELFFDVYNSIQPKPDNDPEENKSGIGLANVKQRLLSVYPSRHELVIRESAKEFFIHLTLQLT